MIKCDNCGWENPDGINRCEKCNELLFYDVFISYSRKDYVDDEGNPLPDSMLSKIKNTLKANDISYWFDEEGIYSGDEFASVITRAIRISRVFLFISSVNSNQSKWTSNEISTALELNKIIIPLRLDNSPYNDSIMMKIVSFDYIECRDEEKAMKKLLRAVNHHLPKHDKPQWRNVEVPKGAKGTIVAFDVDGEWQKHVFTSDSENVIQKILSGKEQPSKVLNKSEETVFVDGEELKDVDRPQKYNNRDSLLGCLSLCVLASLIIWLTNVLPGNYGLYLFLLFMGIFVIAIIRVVLPAMNNVFPFNPNNENENIDWIDLGLPSRTLWAKCNVGTNSPNVLGELFSWGEVIPKNKYERDNYSIRKLTLPSIVSSSFDAATRNCGEKWCMPSIQQFEELMNCCSMLWIDDNDSCGYKIVGMNGNELMLPAVKINGNYYGHYWTCDEYDRNTMSYLGEDDWEPYDRDKANALIFDNYTCRIERCDKYLGFNVRPVKSKKRKRIIDG